MKKIQPESRSAQCAVMTILPGETTNKYRARFAALKQQYPTLSRRGIIALLRHDPAIRREAIRLGFDARGSEVAR